MSPELRERIIAHNKAAADRRKKAADMEELLEKLKPVLALIWRLLPHEVKSIIGKYVDGV